MLKAQMGESVERIGGAFSKSQFWILKYEFNRMPQASVTHELRRQSGCLMVHRERCATATDRKGGSSIISGGLNTNSSLLFFLFPDFYSLNYFNMHN